MKSITTHIQEKLKISSKSFVKYQPKTYDELQNIIRKIALEQGPGTQKNPLNLNCIDISAVDDIQVCFSDLNVRIDYLDVSEWNVGKFNEIINLFFGLNAIEIDCSGWTFENTQYFNCLFLNCANLKRIKGIENWNVSNIKDMKAMFCGCHSLEEIDLSKWKTDSLKDIRRMFKGCKNLKNVGDLSNWNTENLYYTNEMFWGCTKLMYTGNLNKWNNVRDANLMFFNTPLSLNKPSWYTE